MKQITPLPLRCVRFTDGLPQRMQQLVKEKVIPYQWDTLHDRVSGVAKSHCIENFRIAAGLSQGEFYGNIFQDSDLYKWLEATAYCIEVFHNPEQEAIADSICELIRMAQQPDGYINTYYTIKEPDGRFTTLQQGHELYCAGHFFEAAVAYYKATSKRAILDTACRFADYLTLVFGPGEGQNHGYPGHQVAEVGLIKLYKVTNNEAYLNLAAYFISQRGQRPLYFPMERERPGYKDIFNQPVINLPTYAQTHIEPARQTEAVGHAVRALYMYSAMADLATLCGDDALARACNVLYKSVTQRRMYITGGVGSTYIGESFTGDYDLPNDTIYGESCASVALMMFASRMTSLTGDGAYYDTVERAFFNQVLGGISLTGTEFFYVGPLQVDPDVCRVNPSYAHIKTVRQRWFDVACCPTNIARTVMSIAGYAFGSDGNSLYIHIPFACEIQDGRFALQLQTQYPYGNTLRITALAGDQRIKLRQSAFAPIKTLTLNDKALPITVDNGYITLPALANGDVVLATMDMQPHYVVSHPKVIGNTGKASVMRGPLVYCAEQADNDKGLASLALPEHPSFSEYAAFDHGGAVTLTLMGTKAVSVDEQTLYQNRLPEWEPQKITLIPYYLWANRGEGEMRVYLNVRP
ncbi:MAG: glycoside hydrolase family 127 protein [Eubacteriales bacterium]|nr:glycoside hydrolase family 127 protein [Eubacteriales bacterium]